MGIRICYFFGLVLCFLAPLTALSDSKPSELSDYQQQQINLLDKLHQAGLISDALLNRRRSMVLSISTELAKQNLAPVLAQNQDQNHSKIRDHSALNQRASGEPGITGKGRYVALVIGGNNYNEMEPLDTAINDARAIAQVLKEKFGFTVELIENPTRRNVIGTLAMLRKNLKPTDNFILYYAGHGHLDEESGRGYWLPVDAEKHNPSNWISTTEVSDALLTLKARHVLVIADSCYSGSLVDSQIVDLARPLPESKVDPTKGPSRTVITSGGLEPVLDSIDGTHSVFANALLHELENYKGGMRTGDLFQRVFNQVKRVADQTPGYYFLKKAGHQSGEFSLPYDLLQIKN